MSINIDSLNYLGTFDEIGEVYAVYPSGGVPGNFVIVGGQVLYWDETTMRWTPREGGTADNLTVNGRLTADEVVLKDGFRTTDFQDDTQGSALRKVDGQWTLSVDKVNVRNGNSIKGQSTVTSFVFCRRNTKPPTPLNGDFYNPQPDGNIWKDGVPAGTEPIWMSSRIFTSDGNAPQQAGWKDPVLLRDDKDHDIEFSPWPTASVPEAPNGANTQGGSGIQIWFDPDNYTGSTWPQMNWMAIATKYIDSEGNTVYGPWTISLIKGERGADGDTYEHVFYRTELPIQPLVLVNQNQYQRDDYLPGVANVSACLGEGNTFTDDPKGVNEQYKYEWFLTRHKSNGTWKSYANGGRPALWATFSRTQEVTIGSNGHWFIDGVDTGKVAVGKDGAVATVKGRVDVYYQADAETGQTSLETYPASLQGDDALETGDCWVVLGGENGDEEDVSGHLFLYIGGNHQNWEDDWQDLGEFKGEKGDDGDDGHSQYLYLAWASNVTFNEGNPQTFNSAEDFTTDPAVGQNYGWLGIKVSETELPNMNVSTNAYLYKWNYLAGRDGMDYEHIYIRTSVDTPPEINANVVSDPDYQDPEFLPEVDNMTDYVYSQGFSGNTIESDEFTDDPGGISERWPYEWQARRDKVGGVWQMFTQPVLHRNWSRDGEGQVYIATDEGIDNVFINCDSTGKPKAQKTIIINAKLYYGSEACELVAPPGSGNVSSVSVDCQGFISGNFGNQSFYAISINSSRARITLNVKTGAAIGSGTITINLVGTNGFSATKVIGITQVMDGAEGSKGDKGDTGPVLRYRGEWDGQAWYVYNSMFRDCTKYDDIYYIMAEPTQGNGVQTDEPEVDDTWESLGAGMKFFATELLLAENAAIQLLSTNKLIFTDADGNKTAGINEDGEGSHVTYYTDPPYGKRKDDNADGWTYYYNNDANNTLAWKLGPGGVIIKASVASTMSPVRMSSSAIQVINAGNWSQYPLTMRTNYTYSTSDEQSQVNGCFYQSNAMDSSGEPTSSNLMVPNGTYALEASPHLEQEIGGTSHYYLNTVTIVNGKETARNKVIADQVS